MELNSHEDTKLGGQNLMIGDGGGGRTEGFVPKALLVRTSENI